MTDTVTHDIPCPLCGHPVTLPADPLEGEVLDCGDCGADLELTSVEPPTLAEAPEVAEDWGE